MSVGPDIEGRFEVYQLSKSLQTALFGGVYEARGLSSDKLFAIKVLHKSELNRAAKHPNQDFCEVPLSELRFQTEMSRLANVVEVVDSFEDQWCHYIVFDLGGGGDLLEALKKKPFGFAEQNAQYLIRMAAQGIASLHNRNLAMQDVSLENMLLFADECSRAVIKICDPGQAVLFEREKNDENQRGMGQEIPVPWRGLVGKSFRPPELQHNRPYLATKVDSWCLGWSTFYLLVAQPLFMNADMTDSGWKQFIEEEFALLVNEKTLGSQRASLSPKAQDFVYRLMEMDPKRRMSVNEALSHPWLLEHGVAPLLIGDELRLLEPPMRQDVKDIYPYDKRMGFDRRGRSPSPKNTAPVLQIRAASPIQIPNLRSCLALPRQGSPIGSFLQPRGHGGSLRPGIMPRSLSPPQILIRPQEIAAPRFAWASVNHSPSPPRKPPTPRKCAPMPIQVNGRKPIQINASKAIQMNGYKPLQMNASKPMKTNASKLMKTNASKPMKMNTSKPIQTNGCKPIQMNASKPIQSNGINPLRMNVKKESALADGEGNRLPTWTWSDMLNGGKNDKPICMQKQPNGMVTSSERNFGQVPGPHPAAHRSLSPFQWNGIMKQLETKPVGRFVWESALTRVDTTPKSPALSQQQQQPTQQRTNNSYVRNGFTTTTRTRALSPDYHNGVWSTPHLTRYDLRHRALSPSAPFFGNKLNETKLDMMR
eukprot:GEMP01016921.1.p1 GENE.GEMP01016921.1~~GEMP01016921.1.p1  ORF type:complete len:759 (+),score=112.96 GEMP01016921.1:162-2279(+)